MRFNSRGEAVVGLGKRWLTDRQQIFQTGSDSAGWHLVDQFGIEIDGRGASHVAAGGGRWAAVIASNPIESRSSFGYASRVGHIEDIASDGTAVEIPEYHARDRVGVVGGPYQSLGIVLEARAFPGGFVASLDDGHHAGRVFSSRSGMARLPAGVKPFTVHQMGDVLLYTTHRYLILQQFDRPHGMVIAEAPAFYPDGLLLPDGSYLVGWTLTQGDTGLQTRTVTASQFTDISGLSDAEPVPAVPVTPVTPVAPVAPEPPPAPAPVRVPDVSRFVALYLESRLVWYGNDETKTRTHTFQQVNALALELRKTDARWGLLEKPGGPRDRAADVLLYQISDSQAQVVDVVANAEGAEGKPPSPYWELKDIREIRQWKPPYPIGQSDQPVVTPAPDPHVPPDPGTALTPILTPLQARITELEKEVGRQRKAIADLESRLASNRSPRRVAFKTAHGRYVAAEPDGHIVADRAARGQWEVFDLEPVE